MKRRRAAAVLLVLLAVACDAVLGPRTEQDAFEAYAASGRLVLRNLSAAPVHYIAVEESTAALVDLNPDPREWPSIAPGAEVRIPFRELTGYHRDARQARVYWWTQDRFGDYRRIDLR